MASHFNRPSAAGANLHGGEPMHPAPESSVVPRSRAAPSAGQAGLTGAAARFKVWRERLLDLSLRNKLLNFRTDTRGALVLDVPDVARFEDLLALDESFSIQPRQTPARGDDPNRRASDLEERILHCPMDAPAMSKRAIHLQCEARTALEDGGANVLYVGIGFLKWFDSDSSEQEHLAPLLLVPISLEYTRATGLLKLKRIPEDAVPNATLIEKVRVEFGIDLSALANIAPDESGLDIPAMLAGVTAAIERMKRWEVLPQAYVGLFSFTKFLMWNDLEENCEALLENEVVRHIANSATEPFTDRVGAHPPERLDDDVPPAELPLVVDSDSSQTSAVLAAARGRSFVLQGPPGTGKSQTITNIIAAALAQGKTVLFVSEKMAALEVVYRRLTNVGLGDFCLELHSHKTQKKQVLQALGTTLDRAERAKREGFAESAQDLQQMRAELNAYVRAAHAPTPIGFTFHQATAKLIALQSVPEVRVLLPNIRALRSEELKKALTLAARFGASAAQVEPAPEHPFRECGVAMWTSEHHDQTRHALTSALAAAAELDRAIGGFSECARIDGGASLAVLEPAAVVARALAEGPVPTAWRDEPAWRELRERVAGWADGTRAQLDRRADLSKRWTEALFAAELEELDARFQRWATAFFLFAWLFLLGARKRLREAAVTGLPGNRQISLDLAKARKTRDSEEDLSAAERALRRAFEGCAAERPEQMEAAIARGETLRTALHRARAKGVSEALDTIAAAADPVHDDAERQTLGQRGNTFLTALAAYRSALEGVRNLLLVPEHVLAETLGLRAAADQLRRWADRMDAYRAWCLYAESCRAMTDAALRAVVDAHGAGHIRGTDAESVTQRALLAAWVAAARDADPVLREFDGTRHHQLVERFRKADKSHIKQARHHVAAILEKKLPRTGQDVAASSEPGILRRELAKKARHMALRKLLQQIPNLLVRLKPCLLMSPLSVAQYLPARGRRFDLVVFDEASQICTYDAIGAIGRGEQVVVVGDSKQLPPTNFFQAASAEEAAPEDGEIVELESVLGEVIAAGLPEQMLGWHYRSRHEALIEFSNQQYYDNRLNVFPAARGRVPDLGVKFHHVRDGVYEPGKSRANPVEAGALVNALVEALRNASPTERTFGVVTFSMAQQELIEELLRDACARYPEIEPHFSNEHPKHERVFVKNLENVQGDERDDIYFSICYGPDENGKTLMNFGPLNRSGGERRLNVAVTRARMLLRVFSSMTHDHIDTKRTQARGARDLQNFLRFAADRSASSMARSEAASGDFDSDFERDVHDALRASGFQVDTQVGCGAYRIDLAVVHPEHPGVYALGIECDGAAYHSGVTARDRDRLRQEVLEGLGWRLHRIWSTDWSYARGGELQRLLGAIGEAMRQPVGAAAVPRPQDVPPSVPPVEAARADAGAVDRPAPRLPPPLPTARYRRVVLESVTSDPELMYERAQFDVLRRLALRIADAEAPVHVEDLGRRVASSFGAARLTARVRRRIQEVVELLPGFVSVDEFVWKAEIVRETFAAFRAPAGPDDAREPEQIAVEEIAAAAAAVLARGLSVGTADLFRETARIFGIQRLGPKVEARMRMGLTVLVRQGLCAEEGERVTWHEEKAGSR